MKQIKNSISKEILQISSKENFDMKIAIYNDDFYESKLLKRLLYNYANLKKFDCVVDIFWSAGDLYKNKDDYILFFISFKTKSGIRLAELFHKCDLRTPMIITAADCCHALQAFKINAFNFLQTPIKQEPLFEILENFFNTVYVGPLLINNGYETVCINTNDIFYLEADNKHCFVHLKNQTVPCNKTMARVFNVLPEDRFLKISRAFVVNSNYVSSFNSEYVTLINGATLHPSRHFYKTFKYDYYRTQVPKIP